MIQRFTIALSLVFFTISFFAQTPTTITLQPGPTDGIDTYICSVFPNEAGYDKGMLVTAWTLGGEPYIGQDVFKFDLSSIPLDAFVIDARLSLYFDIYGSWFEQSGNNESWIKKVTSNWNKMTVCWNNRPSTTETGRIDLPATTLPQQDLLDINVKHFVSDWVANPSSNFGMMMGLYAQDPYNCLVLSSFDGFIPEKRPKLVITYLSCPPPSAEFSYLLEGLNIKFQDNSTSANSWQWNFGDGSTSTLQNPEHIYDHTGTYGVSLKVQDSCGIDSVIKPVVIPCTLPVSHFVYYPDYPNIQFYDSSTVGNLITRLWDFGDGTFSSLPNPIHQFENSGTYQICLTVTDSCGSSISCDSLNYFLPLDFNIIINPSKTDDKLVQFEDNNIGNTFWEWDFGDGNTSNLQNPIHQYTDYGNYEVCLKAGNTEHVGISCKNIDIKIISSTHTDNPVIIYPNPTTGQLFFRCFKEYQSLIITIEDQNGKTIIQKELTVTDIYGLILIDLEGLQKGIYFVHYNTGDIEKTLKIILK